MIDGNSYDLFIIGGGINGVGIARDAAGRGLRVGLVEQGDLGQATSSASSKLLHGGIRYLEQYQFRMVRHALAEREVLMRAAPHIIQPLRFVMPNNPDVRPAWKLRAGIFLYDRLARRDLLPGSEAVDLITHPTGKPLAANASSGFIYSDCLVDDSRLVVLNAIDARSHGAEIMTRTGCVAAERQPDCWQLTLLDLQSGESRQVTASVVVNAAGPWAAEVLGDVLRIPTEYSPRLVKGSHIVVPRLYDGGQAYILQQQDRRVVFVIPFEQEFSIIGTTDIPYDGDPGQAEIDSGEIDYLCDAVNAYFSQRISVEDVVWTYSGVRPLFDDGSADASAITRDYVLELNMDGAAVLTVWGGKLTGYRLLAEAALQQLAGLFPEAEPAWTASAPLPGGQLSPPGFDNFVRMVDQLWDWLPPGLGASYTRRYGNRIHTVLGNISSIEQLGQELTPGLYEREARYLINEEWALSAEDLLWRRTKLGLLADHPSVRLLEDWLARSGNSC